MMYPVFLINLDRQAERLRLMTAQLANIGITPQRLAAADGRDPVMRARAAVAPYAPLTDGEVGCFESHRAFWKQVVAHGGAGAYVLEDDMAVASDLADITFPPDLLARADMIKIDESLKRASSYGSQSVDLGDGRHLVRLLGSEMSTGCYFVTQKGARRLLEKSRSYILPVDIFLFDHQSAAFWDMEVWKLCNAAAVQLHMLSAQETLAEEFQDRIQGAARPEAAQGLDAYWRRSRLRLHRLLQGDTRPQRQARAKRNLQDFARMEPVSEHHIQFSSPDDTHFRALLPDGHKT